MYSRLSFVFFIYEIAIPIINEKTMANVTSNAGLKGIVKKLSTALPFTFVKELILCINLG